jgi:hypothetical protein
MNMSTLNWPAIIVAALSTFLIGGLWYSPALFGKRWMKENNFTKEGQGAASMGKVFGLAFLWSFVMSFNLGMYLNAPGTNLSWGATAGFLAGFGWVTMAIFVIGLFERKSVAYMLIHAGYMTVSFVVMGAIIGAWR